MAPSAWKSKDSHKKKKILLHSVHLMFEKFFRSFCIAHMAGKIFYKYLTNLICLPLNSLFSYRLPPPWSWLSGVTGLFGRQKSLILAEGLGVLTGRKKRSKPTPAPGICGKKRGGGKVMVLQVSQFLLSKLCINIGKPKRREIPGSNAV